MKVQTISVTDHNIWYNLQNKKGVGLESVPGDIQTGTLEKIVLRKGCLLWKPFPSSSVQIKTVEAAYQSHMHVIILDSFPDNAYVALAQYLTEDIVALTLLHVPESASEHEWTTTYHQVYKEEKE